VLLGWRGVDPLNAILTAGRNALHYRHIAEESRKQQRASEHDDPENCECDEVLEPAMRLASISGH
jgi:hypothetical protein